MAAERDARNNPTHFALRAKSTMDSAGQYRDWNREESDKEALVADFRRQLDGYPAGVPVPDGFVDFLKADIGKWNRWERQRSCFDRRAKTRCSLLQIDLNRDGTNEIVLWKMLNDSSPRVYRKDQGQWKWIGQLQLDDYRHPNRNVQADLYIGEFGAVTPEWNELRIGQTRFRVRQSTDSFSED